MRITNMMMTSRMMTNINRNMAALDRYSLMQASGKRIQQPSDDPILAARALKFRTNVTETDQYLSNVKQGLSWMETTTESFKNIREVITNIRTLCTEAANGTNTYTDRDKIAKNIEELVNQLGTEINMTYAGRYVFSGYRTDMPPLFETANELKFEIEQTFSITDMESTKSYQKAVNEIPTSHEVNILKLAYQNVTVIGDFTAVGAAASTVTIGATTYAVTSKNINDPTAYTPAAGDIHVIAETGELVLGENAAADLQNGDLKIVYSKTGFKKGELNPKVNFDCYDMSGTAPVKFTMDGQEVQYEFSTNTRITINSLAKDVYTDKIYADLKGLVAFTTGIEVSDENQLYEALKSANPALSDDEIHLMVQEQLAEEKKIASAALYDRFNNSLAYLEKHFSSVTSQDTNLGSRMTRLGMIQSRLTENKTTYAQLLSENEDADLVETTLLFSAAQTAYNASLMAGAKIMQLTLADYVR